MYNSPYAFSENKVVAHIELEGLEAVGIEAMDMVDAMTPKPEPSGIQKFYNAVANMFSLGDDRGGFALTGTGMASHPLPDVRGRVDDNSLVDLDAGIVDIPSFRGPVGEFVSALDNVGDLHDAIDGSGIGILLAPKEKEVTIDNTITENGDRIPLTVKTVKDTSDTENFTFYHVTTKSGNDSTIQVSKTPEKKDEQR